MNPFFEQKEETRDVNVTKEHSLKDIVQDIALEDGGVLRKLGVVRLMSCKGEDTLMVYYLKDIDTKPVIAYLKESLNESVVSRSGVDDDPSYFAIYD